MENKADTSQITKDFESCKFTSDYENFLLKYAQFAPDSQLVKQAKNIIASRTHRLKSGPSPWAIMIASIIAIALGISLFKISMSYEGAEAYTVYHGEHADYKFTNFETLLGGPVSMIGGLILMGGGLWYLIVSIMKQTKKK